MNKMVKLIDNIKRDKTLGREDARKILNLEKERFAHLLFAASEIRRHFKGNSVTTCAIVNAKNGLCSEDCAFCAQSAHNKTGLGVYPLMSDKEMLERAEKEEAHSRRFGIVTAGKGLNSDELETVKHVVGGFYEKKLVQKPCASLGILTENDFASLGKRGLTRYHHNIETSKNFYPQICTTHSYDDRVETIRAAQKAGLETCVGGILGMGESKEDRLDFLYEIRGLSPDSVPINFLVPISGTPLEKSPRISLWEAVKIIALARFIMPEKDIKLGAGRLEIFKDAQHLVFLAGANGMIVGDLLTIKGRSPDDDLKLIDDLGLELQA
ncbi:MAG: biotin synthase BioB [Deltaproteobacteria bacterium]|nr:biotin synthase BioB [Deltaproteobacteria bacterium]